jgi:hypothetical protein
MIKNETDDYPALEERFSAAEKLLGINKPVPRNVYERIKHIEDRLLFLESISPEYKDLWVSFCYLTELIYLSYFYRISNQNFKLLQAIDGCSNSIKSFDATFNDKFKKNGKNG